MEEKKQVKLILIKSYRLNHRRGRVFSDYSSIPTRLSPFGKNLDKLKKEKNLVLYQMYDANFITKEEYESAKIEVVEFPKQNISNIKLLLYFILKNI